MLRNSPPFGLGVPPEVTHRVEVLARLALRGVVQRGGGDSRACHAGWMSGDLVSPSIMATRPRRLLRRPAHVEAGVVPGVGGVAGLRLSILHWWHTSLGAGSSEQLGDELRFGGEVDVDVAVGLGGVEPLEGAVAVAGSVVLTE